MKQVEVLGSGFAELWAAIAVILETKMEAVKHDKDLTGLVIIDPYNDFISEGGKLWPRIRAVAEANDCVSHMLQVLNAACGKGELQGDPACCRTHYSR